MDIPFQLRCNIILATSQLAVAKANTMLRSTVGQGTAVWEGGEETKSEEMATTGMLAVYDSKNQTWKEYFEIIVMFMAANDIDNRDKQRAFLELVSLLKKHFDPKPSKIVQRYKFDSRNRKANESVMEYAAELRWLSQDCNYGDTFQQMLRDRIVCGINDDRIQRRLLAEVDLTFD